MPDKPPIDNAVEEKIDEKIDAAKLPTGDPLANRPPTTTSEEDLKTRGQRRINIVWEVTQAVIAIGITGAVIYSALVGIKSEILNTAFVLVISMYLVRTNHTKVGGIGGTDTR